MNQETEFVLKKFGVKPPRMCTDVNPKIRDVDYREMPGIPGSTSLRKAWEIMRDQKIDTLPVTSADNELEGVITVKDIATANMDVFDTEILAKSKTSYKNILETLDGTMVVGSEDAVCATGRIRIGTATPEMLESTVEKGDIVILTNRYESQLCAIEKEAALLIICNGSKVGRTIQRIAEETGVAIMTTPEDTYAVGKLISQCAPISYYMTRDDIMKFTLVTPVADVTRVMAKVRHRYFPILDEDGKYCGMVSRRNIINLQKRRIILVDHNEATQAVEGFDQAEILEIIDHHRIGSLETSGPVYFRNQPVGCTATIITQMYDENGVEIPQKTAGLLLAAIIAASISTADSQLLVASSSFTADLYKPFFRKNATEKETLMVGRILVLVLSAIAFLIANSKGSGAQAIMDMVENAWGAFGASFGPTILLSLFWRRFNYKGAVAGVVSGFVVDLGWLLPGLTASTGIFEIVPGFIASFIIAVIVAKCTAAPNTKAVEIFDKGTSKDAD